MLVRIPISVVSRWIISLCSKPGNPGVNPFSTLDAQRHELLLKVFRSSLYFRNLFHLRQALSQQQIKQDKATMIYRDRLSPLSSPVLSVFGVRSSSASIRERCPLTALVSMMSACLVAPCYAMRQASIVEAVDLLLSLHQKAESCTGLVTFRHGFPGLLGWRQ